VVKPAGIDAVKLTLLSCNVRSDEEIAEILGCAGFLATVNDEEVTEDTGPIFPIASVAMFCGMDKVSVPFVVEPGDVSVRVIEYIAPEPVTEEICQPEDVPPIVKSDISTPTMGSENLKVKATVVETEAEPDAKSSTAGLVVSMEKD
jgi:hypothetical protein